MTLWLRVRALPILIGVAVATIVVLLLPWSGITATPSPAGASVAAASMLALALPVTVAWANSRGDVRLEAVSTRPIKAFDLTIACAVIGATAIAAAALFVAHIAPTGLVAARALLVYLGLVLAAVPFGGWRLAAVAPTVYLTAVVVMGRGEDVAHPAVWAWIAADGADTLSWILTSLVLVGGLAIHMILRPQFLHGISDE